MVQYSSTQNMEVEKRGQLVRYIHMVPSKVLILTIWFVSACEYTGNGSRYKA